MSEIELKLNPDVFCTLPFIHINNKTDGQISACCHSSQAITKTDGTFYQIDEGDSFEEAFHSPYMQRLRDNMLQGIRDSQCSQCWRLEDLGLTSKRQHDGNRYLEATRNRLNSSPQVPFQPLSWDIKLGSHCNLKCRMCDPKTSTSLMSEAVAIGDVDSKYAAAYVRRFGNLLNGTKAKEELARLIPFAEEIYFLGGEPTLIAEHLELLDLAISTGAAKNMTIRWSTNLTKFDERFIQRAREFKRVSIDCSIDGVGPINEYIRFPSQWSHIDSKVRALKAELPQARIAAVCTVQIYNAFELEKILQWGDSFGLRVSFNYLSWPLALNAQCLPGRIKKMLVDKYSCFESQDLQEFINWLAGTEGDFASFCIQTARFDQIRNQDFMALVPEPFRSELQHEMDLHLAAKNLKSQPTLDVIS